MATLNKEELIALFESAYLDLYPHQPDFSKGKTGLYLDSDISIHYHLFVAGIESKLSDAKPVGYDKANEDKEDWLRISKSGCSIKLGWHEKRIVASVPNNVMANCTEKWLDDAQRLCDGWNELPVAKAKIAQLEAAHASQQAKIDALEAKLAQVSKDAMRWIFYANPQTALMLGSELDPNDPSIDWAEECNKLADNIMSAYK
jgi:hypothetical protein